jgi:hypothetical protein
LNFNSKGSSDEISNPIQNDQPSHRSELKCGFLGKPGEIVRDIVHIGCIFITPYLFSKWAVADGPYGPVRDSLISRHLIRYILMLQSAFESTACSASRDLLNSPSYRWLWGIWKSHWIEWMPIRPSQSLSLDWIWFCRFLFDDILHIGFTNH